MERKQHIEVKKVPINLKCFILAQQQQQPYSQSKKSYFSVWPRSEMWKRGFSIKLLTNGEYFYEYPRAQIPPRMYGGMDMDITRNSFKIWNVHIKGYWSNSEIRVHHLPTHLYVGLAVGLSVRTQNQFGHSQANLAQHLNHHLKTAAKELILIIATGGIPASPCISACH